MKFKYFGAARGAVLLGLGIALIVPNISAQKVENSALTVSVNPKDGTYSIATRGGQKRTPHSRTSVR